MKKKGNQYYNSQNFHDSITAYSEALDKCEDDRQRSILFKNRAAAYLKVCNFKLALADSDSALLISPGDVKALYRRSQALEGEGRLTEALDSVKMVLRIDATNKEALACARRFTETIQKKAKLTLSTHEKVKDMFIALDRSDVKDTLKVQAARNFAILSRESSGQKELLDNEGLVRLVKLLDHPLDQVVHHILQTLIGLTSYGVHMAIDIVETVTLDKLTVMVKHTSAEVSSSAVGLLEALTTSLTKASKPFGSEERQAIIKHMLKLLMNKQVGVCARDSLFQVITSSIAQVSLQIDTHVPVQYIL